MINTRELVDRHSPSFTSIDEVYGWMQGIRDAKDD